MAARGRPEMLKAGGDLTVDVLPVERQKQRQYECMCVFFLFLFFGAKLVFLARSALLTVYFSQPLSFVPRSP